MVCKVGVAVLSDLHLEFDREILRRGKKKKKGQLRKALEAEGHPAIGPNLATLKGACDVVVVAGDVDLGAHAIEYASAIADWLRVPVILVAGNHEFYHGEYQETLVALRRAAEQLSRVYFLENDRLDLTIGGRVVRFLGCTLWTDFALFGPDQRNRAIASAARRMTDFDGTIMNAGDQVFSPVDALKVHEFSRAWLEKELSTTCNAPTVVVTHHAPSFQSVPSQYRKDLVSAAYASALDGLLESCGAALWIHGHIHTSAEYDRAGTGVICNPRGYRPSELNKRFNPGFVTVV